MVVRGKGVQGLDEEGERIMIYKLAVTKVMGMSSTVWGMYIYESLSDCYNRSTEGPVHQLL